MTAAAPPDRYTPLARALHWTIGLMVIANLLIGIFHDDLRAAWPGAMGVHKSFGLTVLALTLVRIGWRLAHPVPPLPTAMPGWERAAARATHVAFYALLLILPAGGYVFSSGGKYPLNWFGLVDVPKLPLTKADPVVGLAHESHELLGLAMAALVVIHVGAALRHHFVLGDGVLGRMLGRPA